MSDSAEGDKPSRHDPIAPLRHRSFVLFVASRAFLTTAQSALQAAILWQVYEISNSALQLGLIGLARFLPSLVLSPFAGAVADRFDRRTVLMLSHISPLTASAILLITTISGTVNLPVIYALMIAFAITNSFEYPARQSLITQLVPQNIFPNAISFNSAIQQLGFIIGPAFAGIAIGVAGVETAYAVNIGLIGSAIGTLVFVRAQYGSAPRVAISLQTVKEGVRFVLRHEILLSAMALDMFAVIFGGAQALLPIYAHDILKVGGVGYGLLTSMQAAGALVTSFGLMLLPPVNRTGRALLLAVVAYGLVTIAFGLSRSFPLSMALYGLVGATDQVSVVMRQTTIQLATPNELRGRVSSVNQVFVGASTHVGSIESGTVAAATSATFAVVSGGMAVFAVLGFIAAKAPELWRYKVSGSTEAAKETSSDLSSVPAVQQKIS